jgi:hypothetical protein
MEGGERRRRRRKRESIIQNHPLLRESSVIGAQLQGGAVRRG